MTTTRRLPSWVAAPLLGLALLAGLAPVDAGARAPARLALVVGNSGYRSDRFVDLPSAAKDAAKLSEALRKLGFRVMLADDVTAAGFAALLDEIAAEKPAEALLLFYAGHAVTARGETFLLPADAPDPTSLERLTRHALKLSDVVARLADPRRPTLVFVDACRDQLGEGKQSGPRPLPDNVFLAFASQPGAAAVDGVGGRGSPFARALLQALQIPGSSLEAVMGRVQAETARLSLGRQVPSVRSTLQKPFPFRVPAAAIPPGG